MRRLVVMLEELASRAWEVELPWDGRGPGAGAARRVDSLLVRVARGHGAVDVAVGECLAALAVGDRVLRLGFAGIGDYAREVLGMSGRTALGLAALARALAERPLLRAAVRRGEVSPRLAQELLPVARGEAEAGWVARAAELTVRQAREAVRREARAGGLPDEDWERVEFPVEGVARERVDEAMDLAGQLLGATAPRWQRLEAICQEYLGAHPGDGPEGGEGGDGGAQERSLRDGEGGGGAACDGAAGGGAAGRGGGPGEVAVGAQAEDVAEGGAARRLRDLEGALEEETRRWERLLWPEPVAVPEVAAGDTRAVDARLRELAAMRDRWDDLVGHLGLVVQAFGLWRTLGFASFRHYCAERLGMGERTVAQRVWLERKLHELPGLREAMRAGRVTYEKARLVAGVAVPRDVERWVRIAEGCTCVELRRKVEGEEQAQMCARGRVSIVAPLRVAGLLDETFRAVMRAEGRWLPPGDCLRIACEHFIAAWQGIRLRKSTPQRRAIERDGGYCQVPGCSRAAVHAHHVVWRSRGGGDEEENLVSLCAGHHLHGIHRGYVRVSGRAPDGLVWELGEEVLAG